MLEEGPAATAAMERLQQLRGQCASCKESMAAKESMRRLWKEYRCFRKDVAELERVQLLWIRNSCHMVIMPTVLGSLSF